MHIEPLKYCDPNVPLSAVERLAIDRIVGEADVIGMGEMTHGSSEIVKARYRLLRHMVLEHDVTVIVLETDFSRTQSLNEFVLQAIGDAETALSATGSFLASNEESVAFMEWLSGHNAGVSDPSKKVQVFGCDMQSLDGIRDLLVPLLHPTRAFSDDADARIDRFVAKLAALPSDEQLGEYIGLLFDELAKDRPDMSRVAEIQQAQLELVDSAELVAEDVDVQMIELEHSTVGVLSNEQSFFLGRCREMLKQCLEHYRFEKGGVPRDRSMARNLLALREFLPGEKLAFLAANLHVSRIPVVFEGFGEYATTGSWIASELAKGYRCLGAVFYMGTYLGVAGDTPQDAVVVESHVPLSGTLEAFLHSIATECSEPNLLIECQPNQNDNNTSAWPETLLMNLGEAAPKQSYKDTFIQQRPHQQFDGLLFVSTTTPITVLDGYYRFWQE